MDFVIADVYGLGQASNLQLILEGHFSSMNHKDALDRVKTEEDVKDAYIKALGLKAYFKGLVDTQTKEV